MGDLCLGLWCNIGFQMVFLQGFNAGVYSEGHSCCRVLSLSKFLCFTTSQKPFSCIPSSFYPIRRALNSLGVTYGCLLPQ